MKKHLTLILLALVFVACNFDKSPQAPSNLHAVNVQHNLVELEWLDNSDNETEFIIIRNYDQFDRTLRNFYVDTLVKPDTEYRYSVRAINANGFNDSDPITIKTKPLPLPPTTPDSLTISRDFTTIALTWADMADNESEYILDVDGWTFTLPKNSTNWTHTNLEPNSTHTYKLWARNAFGFSDTLLVTATTRGKFTVKWNAALDHKSVAGELVPNGPAAGYELTLQQNDSTWIAYSGSGTSCTVILPGPACATVRAYDSAGNYSLNSEQACAE